MNQIDKKAPVHSDASGNSARRRQRQVRTGLLALVAACALLAGVGAAPAMAKLRRRELLQHGDQPGRDPGHAGRLAPLRDGHRRGLYHGLHRGPD